MPLLDPIPLTVLAGGPEMPSLVDRLARRRAGLAVVAPPEISVPSLSAFAPARPPERLVTVEPDVGERSPGCPCCRLRLDLVDAVSTLARRRSRPAHLVVAVPRRVDDAAASSVTTVAHTVLSDPDLRRWVRLDGVVATLDAVAAVTRLRTGSSVADGVDAERLAIADRVLVGRADRVDGAALGDVTHAVGRLNPIAQVLAPATGDIEVGRLLGIDAWHGAPAVTPAAAGPDVGPPVVGAPDVVVIEQHGVLDPGGVEDWLDEVLAEHAPRLYRLQGALAVDGEPTRICCHGVGSFATSHPEREHGPGRRSRSSLMVLIGHDLPAGDLAAGLRATAVR